MTSPTKTTGSRVSERAQQRRQQTYCACGEPKGDRSRYCTECKAASIQKHATKPARSGKPRRTTASRNQRNAP